MSEYSYSANNAPTVNTQIAIPVITKEAQIAAKLRQNRATLPHIPLNCRNNVLTPPVFRTVTRKLRTFEGSPAYTNVPATIKWQNVRYQIAPARFPHETVAATYREVTEKVTVLRERIEIIGKPAIYKTIRKPITTQEAYTGWKPGCAAPDPLQCITRIPAKTQIITQEFIDIPASVMQIPKPTKIIEFKRKELITPGQGHGEPIPAVYKDVTVGRVSKVWQIIAKQQPDRFAEIPVQVKIRPERIRPVPTVCYDAAAAAHITEIQKSLRQRGYQVSINGTANQQTLDAIVKFQQDKQLSLGAITLETLRALELH